LATAGSLARIALSRGCGRFAAICLIQPFQNGRVVERTGDGVLVEFRSVINAVRCAIDVQNGMLERNWRLSRQRRIEFRISIHLGGLVEESDGDLMGDGVNVAARLEGIAKPGALCLSEEAYRQFSSQASSENSEYPCRPFNPSFSISLLTTPDTRRSIRNRR
jgi:class 3 adenylate cyclase